MPDGMRIPRMLEIVDFPKQLPLLLSCLVVDVLCQNGSSFPSFAWALPMLLDPLGCAANLSTPPEDLFGIRHFESYDKDRGRGETGCASPASDEQRPSRNTIPESASW
jgi:hypothetical protein